MRIFIAGAVCLLASVSSASGLNEIIESISERAEEVSSTSEVEIVELFHAQTPEELEAALTDGYPMPWLEEILNDESIPEEDRYWLDCRMRAHVAKYLHRFYDRNGNPVEIEAEWISPGEHYWQEHLMVNPVGEDYAIATIPDYLPKFTGEPGTIVNLYGEQTGEMALTQRGIIMSRDGTIAVLKTGRGDPMHPGAPNYACFLYSDGSFKEIEIDLVDAYSHINVSPDGELIVVCTTDLLLDRANGQAIAFDHDGNILFSTEISGFPSARPAISPDNEYIAIALHSNPTNSIVILDATTGELLRRFERWVRQVTFSPDGQRLVFTAASICQLPLDSQADSWEYTTIIGGTSGNYFMGASLCFKRDLVSVTVAERNDRRSPPYYNDYSQLLCHGEEQYRIECSNLDISPNGCLGFCFNSRMAQIGESYSSSFITVISIRERG